MSDFFYRWEQLILLAGIFQGIFLTFFLLVKRKRRKANIILSIIIFLASIQMFLFSIDGVYNYLGCALTNIFSRLIFIIYGPLFYFYTKKIINPKWKLTSNDIIHFIPFITLAILSYWSYQTWDATNGEGWIHHIANTHMFSPVINDIFRWLHLTIYLIFSIAYIKNESVIFENHLSSLDKVQIKWLVQFLIFAFIMWSLVALGLRLNYITADPNKYSFQFLFIIMTIFMYWITYKSISYSKIFIGHSKTLLVEPIKNKYQNSNIKNEKLDEIELKLKQFMVDKAPFLNSNFRLEELSNSLNISRYHISQTLNEHLNQNFYDFINTYRIAESKIILSNESMSYLTIEAIAFDCGFNSKSTFIKVFKKIEGTTPGEYRNKKLS